MEHVGYGILIIFAFFTLYFVIESFMNREK